MQTEKRKARARPSSLEKEAGYKVIATRAKKTEEMEAGTHRKTGGPKKKKGIARLPNQRRAKRKKILT